MSLYVTGDTHGNIDIKKISENNFKDGTKLTKNDYLLICGDCAAVWDGGRFDSDIQEYWNSKPWTTLYVDGNHENHDLLNSYDVVEWNGGNIHKITDSIFHLCRGQIFTIDGKKMFVMGGANSVDKHLRIEGRSWWKNELPSREEINIAIDNLNKNGNSVDYIFTHCAPDSYQDSINPYYEKDIITSFLENVSENVSFEKWFCGHYHEDKTVGKMNFLYNRIIKVF